MKINKWISKSQTEDDRDDHDDDFNDQFKFHSKQDGFNYYGGSLENQSRNSSAHNSNRYYSPRYNTISPGFKQEYETQSFTLDFNDDISLTSNHALKEKAKQKQNGPKTEARVYVNNPEIFTPPNQKQLGQVSPLRSSRNHSSPPTEKSITNIVNNYELNANLLNIPETAEDHSVKHHNENQRHKNVINSVSVSPTVNQQENIHSKMINITDEIYSRKDPVQISTRPYKSTLELSSPRSSIQPILVSHREMSPKSPKSHHTRTQKTPSIPVSHQKSSATSLKTDQNSSMAPPPPPPPPPPPLSLFAKPADGLLKFASTSKKIHNNKPKLDKNMESLQEELEKKLVKVRKSLAIAEKNNEHQSAALISIDNQNNIHRFDPSLVEHNSNNSNVEVISNSYDKDLNSKGMEIN